MPNVDELVAAIVENRSVVELRKERAARRRAAKRKRKPGPKRVKVRPVSARARRNWIAPELKHKHRARWGRLAWVERTLRARKDAAILAMVDDGLTWRQIMQLTGVSESEVARSLRRARAGSSAPSPEGQPG